MAIRSGAMSLDEATVSHGSHVLTNCLGKREFTLAVNAGPTLRDGDRLLVCSDGLYDMVDDERLAALLAEMDATLQDGASQIRQLLSQANRAGGRDNISVILIQVRDA
jgi:protein phosphatase